MQSLQVLRLASRYIAGTGNRARDLAFGCGGMCLAGCRCEYGAGHAGRIALVWHAQQAVLPLPTPRVGCEHPFVAEGGWCYFSRWALPLVKLLTFRMGAARAFCTSPGRRRLGHQKPRARRFVHGRAVHHGRARTQLLLAPSRFRRRAVVLVAREERCETLICRNVARCRRCRACDG